MENEIFLLKMGEIVLKGLNRRRFEDRLMANVTRRLHPYGRFRVYARQSTVYVEPMNEECDLDGAWDALKKVFGIVAMSRARGCAKEPDAFVEAARAYLGGQLLAAKSVKVESRRAATS
ncbi:MAG: tRNA 4-thiouridine(8) synthase ThiI, partial [Clostridiales bacterium]|nr:tRNA 4-thiouridine(8) synthase ThiI [Clostridiales bacterium]